MTITLREITRIPGTKIQAIKLTISIRYVIFGSVNFPECPGAEFHEEGRSCAERCVKKSEPPLILRLLAYYGIVIANS